MEEGAYISEGSHDEGNESPPEIGVENCNIKKIERQHTEIEHDREPERREDSKQIRNKWPNTDKKLVLEYFKNHINKKITPKKHECEQFVDKYKKVLTITDWVKIKTLVYNTFRLT